MTRALDEDRPVVRRSALGCGFALVLIVLIIAGLTAFIFHRMESWPGRVAQQVREAFGEVAQVQPRITIKERVFFEQTASVLELVVASRTTHVERDFEHQWLGSRKRMRMSGSYDVRAGFDLTKPFNVKVEDKKVIVEVPPPRILSVDQTDIEVLAFESGLWNRVQPQDLEAELRTLPLQARSRATEAGLQKEALELFTKRLKERFAGQFEVEVKVTAPPRAISRPQE